jgi:hypothetical protein
MHNTSHFILISDDGLSPFTTEYFLKADVCFSADILAIKRIVSLCIAILT